MTHHHHRRPTKHKAKKNDACQVASRETRLGSPILGIKTPALQEIYSMKPSLFDPLFPTLPAWMLSATGVSTFLMDNAYRFYSTFLWATPDDLRNIACTLTQQRANEIALFLTIAMSEANVNTPLRKAAFLAESAEETGDFASMRERGPGAEGSLKNNAYFAKQDFNSDLGNNQVGDGKRFRGRGFLQLTGRWNYTRAGKDLGLDLTTDTSIVETNLMVAALTSAWVWKFKKLYTFADKDDIEGLSAKLNGVGKDGKPNGLAKRKENYQRAKAVFNAAH